MLFVAELVFQEGIKWTECDNWGVNCCYMNTGLWCSSLGWDLCVNYKPLQLSAMALPKLKRHLLSIFFAYVHSSSLTVFGTACIYTIYIKHAPPQAPG